MIKSLILKEKELQKLKELDLEKAMEYNSFQKVKK